MNSRPTSTGALVAMALAAAAAGCGGGGGGDADGRRPVSRAAAPPAPTVVTAQHASPAEGIPDPPRRLRPIPATGTVNIADGPFNDRLKISALSLRRGERPRVTGRMLTTADVSEVLALTVDVAFYDRRGHLVTTGRNARQELEEFHSEALTFRVSATKPAPDAVSAVVSVPEYVPE